MYDKSADYYDLIYRSFKDYAAEAETVGQLLTEELSFCRQVLDVACGTGEHHRYLGEHYAITGLDLNQRFIEIARQKNASCHYVTADMRDFALEQRFDAVLCMFSSIGYLPTEADLVKALRCFGDHLVDDGVIIVEAWFTPDQWKPPHIHMVTATREGLSVCRASSSQTIGRVACADMHYLVATNDGVEYLFEEHRLTLYTVAEMEAAFAAAGLTVSHDPKGLIGRSLYRARKRG